MKIINRKAWKLLEYMQPKKDRVKINLPLRKWIYKYNWEYTLVKKIYLTTNTN